MRTHTHTKTFLTKSHPCKISLGSLTSVCMDAHTWSPFYTQLQSIHPHQNIIQHAHTHNIQSEAVMALSNYSLWFSWIQPGDFQRRDCSLSLSRSVMNGSFIQLGSHLVSLRLFMSKLQEDRIQQLNF